LCNFFVSLKPFQNTNIEKQGIAGMVVHPLIPAVVLLMQEDCKFKTSLDNIVTLSYIVRSRLKNKQTNKHPNKKKCNIKNANQCQNTFTIISKYARVNEVDESYEVLLEIYEKTLQAR
jgi:hypothetical protein